VQRVLQPQIGQQIYAPGLRLGTVEQVIISPLRCAVIAMVARGCFAGSAHRDDTQFDPPPLLERRVVIPIAAVRAVTQSAVLLRISGDEAADCDAFEADRLSRRRRAGSRPSHTSAAMSCSSGRLRARSRRRRTLREQATRRDARPLDIQAVG
jgi:hypothetical protein